MYDYYNEMRHDLIDWIADNMDIDRLIDELERESLADTLNDDCWIDDGVTGNGSGSYTFNSYKAREYVIDNMELATEMISEFCVEAEEVGKHFIDEDWEWFDVSIRCYVLSGAAYSLQEDLIACLDALKAEKELTVNAIENALEAA